MVNLEVSESELTAIKILIEYFEEEETHRQNSDSDAANAVHVLKRFTKLIEENL